MAEDVTPIRQQYLDIKKQYPEAIVFFRLGDFYETFDHDAQITSRELDIVLTSRNVAKGQRVPMAGIPYHAAEIYLARLIDKGYHVAICEQVGEQPAKGIFPREVVRVVTPGTVIEPGLLHSNRNNYLAAARVEDGQLSVAYADITTGEFAVLKALVQHAREPLTRDKLMNLARGREWDALERSIDVQISRLRRLIEPDPSKPRYIQTVWGVGYVFVPDGNK